MLYLRSFFLPSADREAGYLLSYPPKLEMQCYSHDNIYPFRIFPKKELTRLELEPITVLYGGNGSGKSTLLNVMAEKLRLERSAPFNNTPFFEDYLRMCDYELAFGSKPPKKSRHISSDDVFDFLLDIRAINEGVDRRRDELFAEYEEAKNTPYRLRSLEDYEELKRRNEAKQKSKSAYVTPRLPRETVGRSNGESAFAYFTRAIGEHALYLLDEPENSLSAARQEELACFLESSARFYGCQFVISTHSPFLLAIKGAAIYDLDSVPVCRRRWTELENVRIWHSFFEKHREEFL